MTVGNLLSLLVGHQLNSEKEWEESIGNKAEVHSANNQPKGHGSYLDVPTFIRQGVKPNTENFNRKAIC